MTAAIIDSYLIFADFLRGVCKHELGLHVLVTETHGRAGASEVITVRPDILLLDILLSDVEGLDIAAEVAQKSPSTRIIAITGAQDNFTLKKTGDIGIAGFIDKRVHSVDGLKNALKAILKGQRFFSPSLREARQRLRRDPLAYFRMLSDYEQQVLTLIGHSLTDAEIAGKLGISAGTAQSRRRDIMRKLDIHSTPKLIRYAIQNGFSRPEHFPHNVIQ